MGGQGWGEEEEEEEGWVVGARGLWGGVVGKSQLQNPRFPTMCRSHIGHFIPQLAVRWETGPCFQIKMATTIWGPAVGGDILTDDSCDFRSGLTRL